MKIEDAAKKFLAAYSDAKRAGWTLTNYGSILRRLSLAFPNREVESLTADEIENFLNSLKKTENGNEEQISQAARP